MDHRQRGLAPLKLKDLNPTTRFSNRVTDYAKYRPSYPGELLDYLSSRIGGLRGSHVADVGAGTGIFTKLLLDRGAFVDAVEPNHEMRAAAEAELQGAAGFQSHSGTAENTGLPNSSVNLITCAQAFHWFDLQKTRKEFDRILKSGGLVALIWNDLDLASPVELAYEKVKNDFGGENFKNVEKITKDTGASLKVFFGKSNYESKFFENSQDLTKEGFTGRFFSSSYAPSKDSPHYTPAAQALHAVFDQYQSQGKIQLKYKTELFLGD